MTKYAQKHGTEFTAHINENTVAGFCAEFSAWKNDNLRGTEKAKIECAKVFFNMLTADGYTVHFRDQLGNKQMAQIISEVMRGEN